MAVERLVSTQIRQYIEREQIVYASNNLVTSVSESVELACTVLRAFVLSNWKMSSKRKSASNRGAKSKTKDYVYEDEEEVFTNKFNLDDKLSSDKFAKYFVQEMKIFI